MRPVVDRERWAEAIAGNHRARVSATVVDPGSGDETALPVVGGAVTIDGRASVRSTMDLEVVDERGELAPTGPTDLLAPYGNLVRVERGIDFGSSVEMIPIGLFRISEVEVVSEGTIRIAGPDQAAAVQDARFEDPYTVASGTLNSDAILAILQWALPDLPYDFAASDSYTLTAYGEEGGDRWEFAQQLADGAGMELYFDGDGTAILKPSSRLETAPVAAIEEGEGGTLVAAKRDWDREGTFNRVVVTGESANQAAIYRGVATDDDPASPTHYYGPFGKVPRFHFLPNCGSNDQARTAAEGLLEKEMGTTERVEFEAVPNPALEPGDTVRVCREKAGIDGSYLLDSLVIPLSFTDPMTCVTRGVVI